MLINNTVIQNNYNCWQLIRLMNFNLINRVAFYYFNRAGADAYSILDGIILSSTR